MVVLGHQRRFERAPATSALPSIRDILLSRSKGRQGQIADLYAAPNFSLVDHLVGEQQQVMWDGEAERFGGLDVDN